MGLTAAVNGSRPRQKREQTEEMSTWQGWVSRRANWRCCALEGRFLLPIVRSTSSRALELLKEDQEDGGELLRISPVATAHWDSKEALASRDVSTPRESRLVYRVVVGGLKTMVDAQVGKPTDLERSGAMEPKGAVSGGALWLGNVARVEDGEIGESTPTHRGVVFLDESTYRLTKDNMGGLGGDGSRQSSGVGSVDSDTEGGSEGRGVVVQGEGTKVAAIGVEATNAGLWGAGTLVVGDGPGRSPHLSIVMGGQQLSVRDGGRKKGKAVEGWVSGPRLVDGKNVGVGLMLMGISQEGMGPVTLGKSRSYAYVIVVDPRSNIKLIYDLPVCVDGDMFIEFDDEDLVDDEFVTSPGLVASKGRWSYGDGENVREI
ncbi:hypothetical protein Dimus_008411 [Dionaea muscipula]